MKLDFYSTPYTNNNTKWIKELNARAKIIKLIKETYGKIFMTIAMNLALIS